MCLVSKLVVEKLERKNRPSGIGRLGDKSNVSKDGKVCRGTSLLDSKNHDKMLGDKYSEARNSQRELLQLPDFGLRRNKFTQNYICIQTARQIHLRFIIQTPSFQRIYMRVIRSWFARYVPAYHQVSLAYNALRVHCRPVTSGAIQSQDLRMQCDLSRVA